MDLINGSAPGSDTLHRAALGQEVGLMPLPVQAGGQRHHRHRQHHQPDLTYFLTYLVPSPSPSWPSLHRPSEIILPYCVQLRETLVTLKTDGTERGLYGLHLPHRDGQGWWVWQWSFLIGWPRKLLGRGLAAGPIRPPQRE